MEIILLEKIRKLGDLGEQVRVKPGYGRNFLIPHGKAVPATAENIEKFESLRVELEKAQQDALAVAKRRAEELSEFTITLARKAGSEGKLFGSVGASDIADAVTTAGVDISKHEVRLSSGPLRMVGEYQVDLHLHADVDVQITLIIEAEDP